MSVNLRTKKGYGDFGNLSKNYDKMRKGFPEDVIDYIFQKIEKMHPFILDIGCGTGIATEQLCEKGANVAGTDVDAEMIRQAEADNRYLIEYHVATAEKQPFKDKMFDAVTAFSAFHWFTNKVTLSENKRVLKPGGYFFAVNKNEVDDFKKKNKEILQRFINQKLPYAKNEYDPKKVLEENFFQSIDEKIFPVSEYFNLEEAVGYIQTMSVWNLVPKNKIDDALNALREHFSQTLSTSGYVERKLNVVVVSGKAP